MNDCFESLIIIQCYYNRTGIFQTNYSINTICIFFRLELLSNFYVKRTVHRQDFGAKSCLTCHNGVPVADILKVMYLYVKCMIEFVALEKESGYQKLVSCRGHCNDNNIMHTKPAVKYYLH